MKRGGAPGDRALGIAIMLLSVTAALVYGYLLFAASPRVQLLVLKATAMALVGLAAGLMAWIGYLMASRAGRLRAGGPEEELERILEEVRRELSPKDN